MSEKLVQSSSADTFGNTGPGQDGPSMVLQWFSNQRPSTHVTKPAPLATDRVDSDPDAKEWSEDHAL